MNVSNTNIREAIKEGVLTENNFLVSSEGSIRPLDTPIGSIVRLAWQNLSQYSGVRGLFGVDNEKLKKVLIEKSKQSNIDPKLIQDNIDYLEHKGFFSTSEDKVPGREEIRKISESIESTPED